MAHIIVSFSGKLEVFPPARKGGKFGLYFGIDDFIELEVNEAYDLYHLLWAAMQDYEKGMKDGDIC